MRKAGNKVISEQSSVNGEVVGGQSIEDWIPDQVRNDKVCKVIYETA
jgi:hypothetical protein